MRKALIVLVVLIIFGFADVVAGPLQNNTILVIVYYFHRTVCCPSCMLLEEITQLKVQTFPFF